MSRNAVAPYILLVEDNPEHAELMKRSLEEAPEPYRVHISGTIAGAVEMIGQAAPMLMFTDQFLPDGNGDTLISISKGIFPVIVLTSQGDEAMAVKMMKSGALDYFPKSADFFGMTHRIVQRSIREWHLVMDKIYSERKIRDQEAWRKEIIESALDGFWIVDLNGKLLEANEKYCEMSGYSKDELLTMSIFDLEASEIEQTTMKRLSTVMIESEDRFETIHRRKDGTTYNVEISVQFRHFHGGKLITFLRDITPRKAHEKERSMLLLEMKNMLKLMFAMKRNNTMCDECTLMLNDINRLEKIAGQEINIIQ